MIRRHFRQWQAAVHETWIPLFLRGDGQSRKACQRGSNATKTREPRKILRTCPSSKEFVCVLVVAKIGLETVAGNENTILYNLREGCRRPGRTRGHPSSREARRLGGGIRCVLPGRVLERSSEYSTDRRRRTHKTVPVRTKIIRERSFVRRHNQSLLSWSPA